MATIFDDDNYYLIAYYAKHPGVVHYRIDRMDMVEMVENQSRDIYNGESIDLKHHKKTIFGMFQGEEQEVDFIANKSCCFVNRFLRDFKKFSKLFLFSGF